MVVVRNILRQIESLDFAGSNCLSWTASHNRKELISDRGEKKKVFHVMQEYHREFGAPQR